MDRPLNRERAVDEGNFVLSLAKGLAIIEAFDADDPAMTLSDVARKTGVTRAAARRFLLTLVELGYARTDGKRFSLRPKVLDLGFSYLHAQGVWGVAQPYMVELVEKIHESCSAAVLDGADIVYVARVPTKERIMSINLGLGSRLPAHVTSMGRVLLAALAGPALDAFIASIEPLQRYTPQSVVETQALRDALARVREQGYSIVDQELESGLRSIAVPIVDATQAVVAALNIGTHVSRMSEAQLLEEVLPSLRATAHDISRALGSRL